MCHSRTNPRHTHALPANVTPPSYLYHTHAISPWPHTPVRRVLTSTEPTPHATHNRTKQPQTTPQYKHKSGRHRPGRQFPGRDSCTVRAAARSTALIHTHRRKHHSEPGRGFCRPLPPMSSCPEDRATCSAAGGHGVDLHAKLGASAAAGALQAQAAVPHVLPALTQSPPVHPLAAERGGGAATGPAALLPRLEHVGHAPHALAVRQQVLLRLRRLPRRHLQHDDTVTK